MLVLPYLFALGWKYGGNRSGLGGGRFETRAAPEIDPFTKVPEIFRTNLGEKFLNYLIRELL